MPTENEIERRIDAAKALMQLQTDVKHCTEGINDNKEATEKLLKALHENGLVTQVALNKQSLGKLWKWVGVISTAMAAWVIRKSF